MDYLMLFVMSVLSICIFLVFVLVIMSIYYVYRQIKLLPRNSKCTWTKDVDALSGEHKTQCGGVFNDATGSADGASRMKPVIGGRKKQGKNKYNKAFKTDSQRLAFFIPSLGFVFTVERFVLET